MLDLLPALVLTHSTGEAFGFDSITRSLRFAPRNDRESGVSDPNVVTLDADSVFAATKSCTGLEMEVGNV